MLKTVSPIVSRLHYKTSSKVKIILRKMDKFDEMLSELASSRVYFKNQVEQQQQLRSFTDIKALADIHRLNTPAILGERQQLNERDVQKTNAAEVSSQVHTESADIFLLNDRQALSKSQEMEQIQEIAVPQSPKKSNDDVCIKDAQHETEGTLLRIMEVRSLYTRKGAEKPITDKLGKKSKTYFCEECNKSFTHKSNYTVYLRIHTGEKPLGCTDCNFNFRHIDALRRHQLIHSGEKPYRCTECNVNFRHLGALRTHQRIHSGDKPYRCMDCDLAFRQRIHLRAHQRIHSGEKPYNCTDCNVGFTQMTSLRIHQRIHSGEKPYRCTDCNVNFRHLSALRNHQRIHSGEKPYKCADCDAAFIQIGGLRSHQRIHSGEKPYRCTDCDVRFSNSSNLRRHQRLHSKK